MRLAALLCSPGVRLADCNGARPVLDDLMSTRPSPRDLDVIAPNLKQRLSGVTSTIIRLVPLQARQIAIAATGPDRKSVV